MPPVAKESAFTRLPATAEPSSTTSAVFPPGPNPKPNGGFSSENPKPRSVSSFRERLLGTSRPSPARTKIIAASVQKNNHRKTSIAPIFKHNHTAAFQEGPGRRTWREPSPDTEPDVLLKKLKKHYHENAETLQKSAMTQLQQAHSDLSRRLRGTLKGEAAFLATIETKNQTLCAPLSLEEIRYEEHGPADGEVRIITNVVGNLVTDAEAELSKVDADISQLWAEWEVAEAEVGRVYRETLPDQDGQEGLSDDTARFTDTLARFRTAIDKEIEDAEAEVDQLSEAAVAMMKEIEKDFLRQTKPDVQIYYKSIDEA